MFKMDKIKIAPTVKINLMLQDSNEIHNFCMKLVEAEKPNY